MTAAVVVMVEEISARIVIDAICNNIGVADKVQVLEHQGKRDLEKSIPRKINGWRSAADPHFIVTRDKDAADRDALKAKLMQLVPQKARSRTKVRIIVPELESWYLGDSAALVSSGIISASRASSYPRKKLFKDLCNIQNAKQEFFRLIDMKMGQIEAAQTIGPHLKVDENASANFQAFYSALHWALRETGGLS